jgi:transmembrane sensor
MIEDKFYNHLVERYMENRATEEELEVFAHLLKLGKLDKALALFMKKQHEASNEDSNDIKEIFLWRRIAVAASIVVVLSLSGYFLLNTSKSTINSNKSVASTHENRFKNDIQAPPGGKAILTLANGSTIVLDSADNGELATEGNVMVLKRADGKVAYNDENSSRSDQIRYNTLTVPKGSKPFQLELADGSQVWLNVSSSITYPTAFIGKERKVKITGEVYFEIAHDATKPFIVSKGETSIEVLGTHFNVSAYDDEPDMKVTLLQGSVNVKSQKSQLIITPGEQAVVTSGGQLGINKNADLDEVSAWRNGKFDFDNADLATVMRQISRWYDVDVVYRGKTNFHFGGQLSRNSSLIEIFKILEISGVRFTIVGKKVTVLP